MKMFMWKRVDQASGAYHSEGGVVVFAETEERARQFANSDEHTDIKPEEMPDLVLNVSTEDGKPVIEECVVFPDAGCC